MQNASITKYLFRIRTRNGVMVENLSISGRDEAEARRKLQRIYIECEILDCQTQHLPLSGRSGHLNYEDVVDLIIAA